MTNILFKVDDRVEFRIDGIEGTGTILGMNAGCILEWYIVLLDTPIYGQKAITIQHAYLTKISNNELVC